MKKFMKKFINTLTVTLVVVFLFSSTANVFAAQTPEKAFEIYNKALKSGNFDEMVNCYTKKRKDRFVKTMEKLSPEKREQKKKAMMLIAQAGALEEYKVLKVEKKNEGKTALLYLKGRSKHLMNQEQIFTYGKVILLNEMNNWKISKVKFKNKHKSQE